MWTLEFMIVATFKLLIALTPSAWVLSLIKLWSFPHLLVLLLGTYKHKLDSKTMKDLLQSMRCHILHKIIQRQCIFFQKTTWASRPAILTWEKLAITQPRMPRTDSCFASAITLTSDARLQKWLHWFRLPEQGTSSDLSSALCLGKQVRSILFFHRLLKKT